MLTDYHVHLRPGRGRTRPPSATSPPTTSSATARPRRSAGSRSSAWPSTSTASCSRSTSGSTPGTGTGPPTTWTSTATSCAGPGSRLGIEADFLPGREDRVANFLDGRPWDYVVGSVHFLRDDAVDVHGEPDWEAWDIWRGADPEKVWARYFETLGEAARSGHVRHPGPPRPGEGVGRPRAACRTATCAASTSARWTGSPRVDVAIEVSTAGPAQAGRARSTRRAAFLEMCLDAGRPVALSSDAHMPEQLGYEYERAVEWLSDLGVTELAVFERPRRGGWSRSDERARRRASASTRTGSRRAAAGARRRRDRRTPRAASPATRDADVLTHAVIDALLGAAGPRRHRPALPGHRRALARRRLASSCCARSCAHARRARSRAGNVDATVACEEPKLGPYRDDDARAPGRGARAWSRTR